ncbi:MAG TPA: PhoPQ-activated protein PqaA family protein [Pirellulales bacterium]|nr:PhoPQ-activated protein PqaA family protein [Pirellulales bacterium]
MKTAFTWQLTCSTLLLVAARGAAEDAAPAVDGALAAYVETEDPSFAWTVRRRGEMPAGEWCELTLTSQKWRDTLWKHQLFLIKPKEVRDGSRALLIIGGGNWKPELEQPPTEGEELPGQASLYAKVAENAGTPVAVLLQVPHQPIEGKREDALISHTFTQFVKTDDATWPLLVPMVKSAVAGMDAVEQFAKKEWSLDIGQFTVTGASKRGWTTWLTAAVDRRVTALAPAVIDTLNMPKQMPHQIASWGKPSEQIHDYTERGLHMLLATPRGKRLVNIVDPYSYRHLIVQPKLIVLGTNDRYWPLDALNLYWSDLPGKKYVLYVPNQGHGLGDFERTLGTLTAFHRQAAGELQLADLDWQFADEPGQIRLRVTSGAVPERVVAWQAEAPTRDFREARWSSQPMQAKADGHEFGMPTPEKGFRAMFGEAVFNTDRGPYFLSTNVRIVGSPEPAGK